VIAEGKHGKRREILGKRAEDREKGKLFFENV